MVISMKKTIVIIVSILLLTGCRNDLSTGKGISSGNTIEKVIDAQINQGQQTNETEIAVTETVAEIANIETQDMENENVETESVNPEDQTTVDYDLTQMSSDMVYATVYQLMVKPDEYVGKTFRIDGNFYATYYEPTQKYYFYCVIQDATACCAQGLEFVWDDGTHVYPDEYPEDNAEVIIEGTFETYREEGDASLYCRLADATLEKYE